MTFLLQFRKATQQKKTKTKLQTCARDCAELQARRVQATHGNRGRKRAAPISPRWVKRSQSDREMDRCDETEKRLRKRSSTVSCKRKGKPLKTDERATCAVAVAPRGAASTLPTRHMKQNSIAGIMWPAALKRGILPNVGSLLTSGSRSTPGSAGIVVASQMPRFTSRPITGSAAPPELAGPDDAPD